MSWTAAAISAWVRRSTNGTPGRPPTFNRKWPTPGGVLRRAASDGGDLAGRSRINMDFHKLLAAHTGNPIFVAIMNGLIAVMHSFMEKLGPPTGDAVYASRRRFIAHLRKRNADAAIAEMAKFLRDTHRHYLSRLDDIEPR